ncbi:MAG: TonB-dependent receptor, partial [Pseudomonadota bacterium]
SSDLGELRQDSIDFGMGSEDLIITDTPESKNTAVFAEFSVPIFGKNNAVPFVEGLTLVVALRYDDYSIEGPFDGIDQPDTKRSFDAFTNRLGVSWNVTESLKFRASRGETFQAPILQNLFEPVSPLDPFFVQPVLDPFAPGGETLIFAPIRLGGNPNLQPQEATNYTVGFDYTPEAVSGLSVSVTWTRINFTNIVGNPQDLFPDGDFTGLVALSEFVPDIVVRDANGNITELALTQQNLSGLKTEALDFDIRYEFETSFGRFRPGILATRTLKYEQEGIQGTPLPTVDLLSTDRGPVKWNLNGFVDWSSGNWSANTTVQYTGGYTNTDPFAVRTDVDSYTTVDLQVNYNIDKWDTRVSVGAENVFDADFPFFDNARGVDSSRVDLRRRVVFIEATKEF